MDGVSLVFKARKQFIEYAKFIDMEKDFNICIESNDFDKAYQIFVKTQKQMKLLQQTADNKVSRISCNCYKKL